MNINFIKFTKEHLPIYYNWAKKEHVKSEWFRDGYQPVDEILKKLDGSNNALPFIIQIDEKNIGFIQYYHLTELEQKINGGIQGTTGFDIFIGEENYIDKGYGTKIVKAFSMMLFSLNGVNKIIVDPFATNKKAQRCYEKAGFVYVRKEKDKVGTEVIIMELKK